MPLPQLNAALLQTIMPNAPSGVINDCIPYLQTYMQQYGITGGVAMAAFLANVAHESNELRRFTEPYGPYRIDVLRSVFPREFGPMDTATIIDLYIGTADSPPKKG